MITAMTTALIILSIFAFAMAVATLVTVHRDGRVPRVPPRSHYEDPQFRSPAASY